MPLTLCSQKLLHYLLICYLLYYCSFKKPLDEVEHDDDNNDDGDDNNDDDGNESNGNETWGSGFAKKDTDTGKGKEISTQSSSQGSSGKPSGIQACSRPGLVSILFLPVMAAVTHKILDKVQFVVPIFLFSKVFLQFITHVHVFLCVL